MTGAAPAPVFAHLLRMTDHRATFEHACMTEPRREHGYCTDDMARVLVVATREPDAPGAVKGLARKALQFLNDAQSYNGPCRNRMDRAGIGPTSPPRTTTGAGASGDWAPPPPTATSAWYADWPRFSSSAPPRPGRRGRGRWRSPPSAPPNS